MPAYSNICNNLAFSLILFVWVLYFVFVFGILSRDLLYILRIRSTSQNINYKHWVCHVLFHLFLFSIEIFLAVVLIRSLYPNILRNNSDFLELMACKFPLTFILCITFFCMSIENFSIIFIIIRVISIVLDASNLQQLFQSNRLIF